MKSKYRQFALSINSVIKLENSIYFNPIFNFSFFMPKILIAPLDWGLGHATRCIPLIRELTALGCRVTIAASGKTEALLRKEFPTLPFLSLKGYRIRYGTRGVLFSIIKQLPRILQTIQYEKTWLNALLKKESFDAIISDNRPGFHHSAIPCIYITHQLQILSGFGGLADRLLFNIHKHYYQRFDEIWVPDFETAPGLAGILSHPKTIGEKIKYIGPLTRFTPQVHTNPKWDLLILLSGPEPQRSLFEKQLFDELQHTNLSVLFVRGLPGETHLPDSFPKNIELRNHLSASELEKEIASASLILCRSGYTTIMDLISLQKKAVLVPTPGQTEQEYLAAHLQNSGLFPFLKQTDCTLRDVLEKSRQFRYENPSASYSFQPFRKIVYEWVETIRNTSAAAHKKV